MTRQVQNCKTMYQRKQLFENSEGESLFLWGARQTGKSTLLKQLFPDAIYIDLLKSDIFQRYHSNPSLLREVINNNDKQTLVIIDEIQKTPMLLDEIHWIITNTSVRFILSGSSPRKIIRQEYNLLGGRALRYELYPLVYKEIPDFNLSKALKNGLLPRHYLSNNPTKLISAYIGSYLQDEIIAEAKIRNVGSFTRFLEIAALSNTEMINYTNIASDCGVSATTVKEYFQILEDTLIGRFLPSFQKKAKRRIIKAPKFYFFDIGVANFLIQKQGIVEEHLNQGKSFEHFIYHEIYSYSKYSDKDFSISYWRTASGLEIDFVLGNAKVAIEVKSSNYVNNRHLKGLKQFNEEFTTEKSILISNDELNRKADNIHLWHWKHFLEKLWEGELI